jgi:hypothetical protein
MHRRGVPRHLIIEKTATALDARRRHAVRVREDEK